MAAVGRQDSVVSVTDNDQVALVEGERFEVRNFGKSVRVRNTIYDKTNFYIDQSRDYVGGRKLNRYLYKAYNHYTYMVIFIASLFAPLFYLLAFAMALVNILLLPLWIQHAYVSIRTMPHVLKQPSLPNHMLHRDNEFFEITMEKYGVLFASSKNAGIGIIATAKGTVKIQVFKIAARNTMKKCIFVSTIALLGCISVIIYCLALGIILTLQRFDILNRPT